MCNQPAFISLLTLAHIANNFHHVIGKYLTQIHCHHFCGCNGIEDDKTGMPPHKGLRF